MEKNEHTVRAFRFLTQHVLLEVGDMGWSDKTTAWSHIDNFTATGWQLVCVTFIPGMDNFSEPGGYAFFRRVKAA